MDLIFYYSLPNFINLSDLRDRPGLLLFSPWLCWFILVVGSSWFHIILSTTSSIYPSHRIELVFYYFLSDFVDLFEPRDRVDLVIFSPDFVNVSEPRIILSLTSSIYSNRRMDLILYYSLPNLINVSELRDRTGLLFFSPWLRRFIWVTRSSRSHIILSPTSSIYPSRGIELVFYYSLLNFIDLSKSQNWVGLLLFSSRLCWSIQVTGSNWSFIILSPISSIWPSHGIELVFHYSLLDFVELVESRDRASLSLFSPRFRQYGQVAGSS